MENGYMSKIPRNDPCPCGSGKKYKMCCMNKAPRHQCVYIGYKEPFVGVTFHDGKAMVHLPDGGRAPADACFSQAERTAASGKKKVLSRVLERAVFDIPAFLSSEYDSVCAIDTNTKLIDSQVVSIGFAVQCGSGMPVRQGMRFPFRAQGLICFKGCPAGEAEKRGWLELINVIRAHPEYSDASRIGIVTDHDRDRHAQYNSRSLPILGESYLPDNFSLLYAGSDSAEPNPLNALVRICDKSASHLLRVLEHDGRLVIGTREITTSTMRDVGGYGDP
jgi:hypothetical protein